MATYISIHTAFAGCDAPGKLFREDDYISIHTAFAGCDAKQTVALARQLLFQSTQPSQAVTALVRNGMDESIFQSTQPSQAVTSPS